MHTLSAISPSTTTRQKAKVKDAEVPFYIVILALLAWLPLPLGSNRDWSSALFICTVSTIFMLWCIRAIATHRSLHIPRSLVVLLGLILAVQFWAACQWVLEISVDTGETFSSMMLGLAYCLLFFLVTQLFTTKHRLKLLALVLVFSGTFQAFFGSYMTLSNTEWLLFGPKEYYKDVVTGTYINRNHMAGYMAMCLSVGIGLLMTMGKSPRHTEWKDVIELLLGGKARLRLALVIMVIALVMTHSRMGNTAFFASLLITGGFFIIAHPENRRRNIVVFVSFLLIDLLVISQYFGLDELKDRIVGTQLEDKVEHGEIIARENIDRDDVFRYGVKQLSHHPWTGFGAGTFETSFQRYGGADITTHFDHAHNDYLEFATDYGLIALIPLAAFVIITLYYGMRAIWQTKSRFRSGIGLGSSMGVLAIMIHSSTDFNLQIPANGATFMVLCAMAWAVNHYPDARSRGKDAKTLTSRHQ